MLKKTLSMLAIATALGWTTGAAAMPDVEGASTEPSAMTEMSSQRARTTPAVDSPLNAASTSPHDAELDAMSVDSVDSWVEPASPDADADAAPAADTDSVNP